MRQGTIASRIKKISIIITIFFIMYIFMFPLYVRYICGKYAINFANVIGPHDMKRYDSFFSKDTTFRIKQNEIFYQEFSEQLISKGSHFSSEYSYGYLEEDSKVLFEKNFLVYLMLPITLVETNKSSTWLVNGEFYLERKRLFFFKIKYVEFEDNKELWSLLLEDVYTKTRRLEKNNTNFM